jgi:hypothetical protein
LFHQSKFKGIIKQKNFLLKKIKKMILLCEYYLYDDKNQCFFSSSINAHGSATGGYVGTEILIYDKKDIDRIRQANRMEIDIKLYKAIENPDKLQLGYPYVLGDKIKRKRKTLKKKRIRKFFN